MLVKKQKNLDSITSRLNNKENLSHNAKQSNTKIGKSRSFLHQIKTYKMRTFNASDKFAPNINTSNQVSIFKLNKPIFSFLVKKTLKTEK